MTLNKTIKHFKLLTPTLEFRDRITNGEDGSSILHARLVYSWLAYRSVHNLGSSTRSICSEVGLHPRTVKQAVSSLDDLVERRGQEWIAVEPPEGLFFTRSSDQAAKHWSDHLAYSILYLPQRGAKVEYPETTTRFGLNHAVVWSYLVRKAEQHGGAVRRFTVAGAAKLFDLDPKTVRSVVGDLVWLKLIERVDLGAYSEIRPLPLTADHLKLFRPKPTVEAAGKVVEPIPKKPRPTIAQFKLVGDRWDNCRRICEGHMTQEKAEEIFLIGKRLGDSPDDFLDEFHRVKAIYDDGVIRGRVAAGVFGGYLKASYQNRLTVLEEQEHEEQRREYLSSPEFQKRLADDRKAAEADPTNELFIASDEAIHARVDFGTSGSYQALYAVQTSLYHKVKEFIRTKSLRPQEEMDESGTLRGKIIKHALGSLNRFYLQPIKATPEEFQQALNRAASEIEPKMPPIFGLAV